MSDREPAGTRGPALATRLGGGDALRVLALLSGGADGLLAARLVAAQGVQVQGVHFDTGFSREDRAAAVRRTDGIPVEILDVAVDYLETAVVRARHGYGSGMNPCLDCRIFMLREAARIASERQAELVVTGEVLGQTRMSQRRASLDLVEHESGLSGRLLRPLSAIRLAPTDAEAQGRLDRSRLAAIHGRSRRDQRALASRLGVDPGLPAGGGCCLLANREFAWRVRDILTHRAPDGTDRSAIELLRIGRHIRLGHAVKAVVARDELESGELLERARGRLLLRVEDGHGAVVLLDGAPSNEDLPRAASLAARYSARRSEAAVEVAVWGDGRSARLVVEPARGEPATR